MGAQGTATLDFGAVPGLADTSVAVTGQTAIVSSSLVEAWLCGSTSDHSEEEHRLESLQVEAGTIVDGTGFTIYGYATLNASGFCAPLNGTYKVSWVWN